MTARKDFDKLVKDLRRGGWSVYQNGNFASATHPKGGSVSFECNHPTIHQAKNEARRIDQKHEEQRIADHRRQHGANSNPPPVQPRPEPPPAPPSVPNPISALMKRKPPMKETDDAVLEILAEFDSKLSSAGAAIVQMAGAIAQIGNKLDAALQHIREEAEKRADAEAWEKRKRFLHDELEDLPVDHTTVITFTTEAEQVACIRALNAYGREHGKEFKPTKEGLRTSIWRTK